MMIDDTLARNLTQAAERLGDALAAPGPHVGGRDQSLVTGATGVALLHGVLAGQDRAHAWFSRVASQEIHAGPSVGLWFGAPALAFALTVAASDRYRRASAALDTAVRRAIVARLTTAGERIAARERPVLAEFDLVHGLTGLGAYLLCRDPCDGLLRDVLAYLVRLTEPVVADDEAGRHAPGWWAGDAPSPRLSHRYPGGHGNFGMAHGIAGPLALLALAMRRGILVDGHVDAMMRICGWLDAWRHESVTGIWWPEHITVAELRRGRSLRTGSARPSWCYGTPGLARAQQLAGIALGDPTLQHAAELVLGRCLADRAQLDRITDAALCHGWAGLTLTAWSAALDARTTGIGQRLPGLLRGLLDRARRLSDGSPGLIDGSAGIALTMHTIATGVVSPWQTCLLLA